MAFFDCMIGGGADEYELIVVCSSEFAGLLITCSDGETTLTDYCPSTAPYEIEFSLPNYGEWTISGTVSGYTITESVLVQPYEAELNYAQDITVDFYGAAYDTIRYVGTDGNTHVVATDDTGHATATINGITPIVTSITFISSVAKDPSNLDNSYSKTISIDSNTTEVYVMPDNVMYWWGYMSDDCEELSTANGWTNNQNRNPPFTSPTYNTNDVLVTGNNTYNSVGIGKKTPARANGTVYCIFKGITSAYSQTFCILSTNAKSLPENPASDLYTNVLNIVTKINISIAANNYAAALNHVPSRSAYIYAFWVEY